jgi:hypothetical protein
MKRQVMQPFRPPRSGAQKKGLVQDTSDVEARQAKGNTTRRSPRRKGKSDKAVHVIPFIKGIKMMSEREATKTAQHGEVLRWSSGSEEDVELMGQVTQSGQRDKTESEDETEFGVVWERFVVKETEGDDIRY